MYELLRSWNVAYRYILLGLYQLISTHHPSELYYTAPGFKLTRSTHNGAVQ